MTDAGTLQRALIDIGDGKAHYASVSKIRVLTSERVLPFTWIRYQGQTLIDGQALTVTGWSSSGFPRHVIRWTLLRDAG